MFANESRWRNWQEFSPSKYFRLCGILSSVHCSIQKDLTLTYTIDNGVDFVLLTSKPFPNRLVFCYFTLSLFVRPMLLSLPTIILCLRQDYYTKYSAVHTICCSICICAY